MPLPIAPWLDDIILRRQNMTTNTFALPRRFSILSLIFMLLAGSTLAILVRQHELQELEMLVEERNVAMTKIFLNVLEEDIHNLLGAKDEANAERERQILGALVASLTRNSDIAKLKIYNPNGIVVFSTDPRQIGEDKSGNSGFAAALAGQANSDLTHRDFFSSTEGERVNVDLLASYIPMQQEGAIFGVIELYQDVTLPLNRIKAAWWRGIFIISGIFALLYLLQLLVVRHAYKAVRAQESLLESANAELDQKITERTEALRQSEQRVTDLLNEQKLIFNNAHVGILLLKNRHILKSNQRIAEMFGYARPEDYEGKSTDIFYRSKEEFLEAGRSGYAQLAEKGFADFEVRMRHKDGSDFWVIQSGRPLNPEDVLNSPSIWVYTNITERKLAAEKISQLAFFDQLTDLPNRTLLADRLRQGMSASQRTQTHGAVLFLDLDHFKTLNDTLGHDQGDILLRQVADILTANVQHGDTVARLGGDEFVILLLDLPADAISAASETEATCRKLLSALKQNYRIGSTEFHSSASIGATLFMGEKTPIEDLLKQADLAMYKSKEAGRNAFTFFDPAMEANVLARTQTEADLRRAIYEQQFVLHYQPILAGNSRQITGAEVLIRWLHPQLGMVFPNDFIQHAEESGLILPIGHWVLLTACQQLAGWAKRPAYEQLTIAVNVSVQQFRQNNFVEQVIAILEDTGANPRRLKLELTESLFVDDIEDIIGKMSALKSIGVGFSLDDFGTGYSSLSYLSRLPLDQLKIDRSFVMDIESSENNISICAATISLAHSLGLKVIAEGVETEAQKYFLTTVHRCDFLQGYLLGKPQSLESFEQLLEH